MPAPLAAVLLSNVLLLRLAVLLPVTVRAPPWLLEALFAVRLDPCRHSAPAGAVQQQPQYTSMQNVQHHHGCSMSHCACACHRWSNAAISLEARGCTIYQASIVLAICRGWQEQTLCLGPCNHFAGSHHSLQQGGRCVSSCCTSQPARYTHSSQC